MRNIGKKCKMSRFQFLKKMAVSHIDDGILRYRNHWKKIKKNVPNWNIDIAHRLSLIDILSGENNYSEFKRYCFTERRKNLSWKSPIKNCQKLIPTISF